MFSFLLIPLLSLHRFHPSVFPVFFPFHFIVSFSHFIHFSSFFSHPVLLPPFMPPLILLLSLLRFYPLFPVFFPFYLIVSFLSSSLPSSLILSLFLFSYLLLILVLILGVYPSLSSFLLSPSSLSLPVLLSCLLCLFSSRTCSHLSLPNYLTSKVSNSKHVDYKLFVLVSDSFPFCFESLLSTLTCVSAATCSHLHFHTLSFRGFDS